MSLTAAQVPLINSGTKKYLFICEGFSALLFEGLDNLGKIEFPFALAVIQEGVEVPVMIIAAEYNPIDSILLGHMKDDVSDGLLQSDVKKYYLSVYDNDGHHTYGSVERLNEIQVFKSKAVEVMKERCGITDELNEYDCAKVMKEAKNARDIKELFVKIQELHVIGHANEIQELLDKIQQLDVKGEYGEKIEELKKTFKQSKDADDHRHESFKRLVNEGLPGHQSNNYPSPSNGDDKYTLKGYSIIVVLATLVSAFAYFMVMKNH